MLTVLLKLIGILAIVFLLCFPFIPGFPEGFKWTIPSLGYSKKERWKNIFFVIGSALYFIVVLVVAPYVKKFFLWLFDLKFMASLVDKLPDNFVYTVDVLTIILANILLCLIFLLLKKLLRAILDFNIIDNVNTGNKPVLQNKKKKRKKEKRAVSADGKDRSETRLKLLRKKSNIVFKNKKESKKQAALPTEYKENKNKGKNKNKKDNKDNIPEYSKGIIGVFERIASCFYERKDNWEYAKYSTVRWANEIKYFLAIIAGAYLILCIIMLLPVFFSFGDIEWYYKIVEWVVRNTYMYPTIAIVVLYEIYLFCNGECNEEEVSDKDICSIVSGIVDGKNVNLAALREELLDKYGAKYSIKEFEASLGSGSKAFSIEEQKEYLQTLALAIRSEDNENVGNINGNYIKAIEEMLKGEHILFDSSMYSVLGEYIIHYLFISLAFGTRALFVCTDKKACEDLKSYLEKGFMHITALPYNMWRMADAKSLHEGKVPDILFLTPEDFLKDSLFTEGKIFFDELTDVFVLDIDKVILSNNYYCLIMSRRLEKATTYKSDTDSSHAAKSRVAYRFFANGSIKSLKNSIKQFFNIQNREIFEFNSFALNTKTDVFIWSTGGSDTVYIDRGANQVTLGSQIAAEASMHNVPEINLITDRGMFSSYKNETKGLLVNHCNISDNKVGYVIVEDDHYNLPNTIYTYSRFTGREAAVLHVISRPYLLRDYFISRAEKFVSCFDVIGEIMAEHSEPKRAETILLLCDAVNGVECGEFIARTKKILGEEKILSRKCGCKNELEACVKACCCEALGGIEYDNAEFYCKSVTNSAVEEKSFIYLSAFDNLFSILLENTEQIEIEYCNTEASHRIPIFKHEISQHFLPGQVIVKDNRNYTVKEVDVKNGILKVDDTVETINVPMDYIQTRHYYVTPDAESASSYTKKEGRNDNAAVQYIDATIFDAVIDVETVGYYPVEQSSQGLNFQSMKLSSYQRLTEKEIEAFKRTGIKTKVLVVEIGTSEESNAKMTYLLSVIFQEMMKTIFPRHYRTIAVCPLFDSVNEEEFFAGTVAQNIRDIYPRIIHLENEMNPIINYKEPKGKIRLAIIEDVIGGNGVVETLVDASALTFENYLGFAADLLAWLYESSAKGINYLNYGMSTTPDIFDIEGLMHALSDFKDQIVLSEPITNSSENSCFFCHKPLEEGKWIALEDERKICDDCQSSSLDTFEALEQCFNAVLECIKSNTSVADTFPSDISIDFVSTAELVDRYKNEREIPIGYCNHVTNCIYIEYGLPMVSAVGVISALITELWQDENLLYDGNSMHECQHIYVQLQTLGFMKFTSEADAFERYFGNPEGLILLKQKLAEAGHGDSFAYFLNSNGKKGQQTITGEIPRSIERDPDNQPKFWYNKLSETEKILYDALFEAAKNHLEVLNELPVTVTADRCDEILDMIGFDNPQLFWCRHFIGRARKGSDGNAVGVIFSYQMDQKEAEKCQKEIDKEVAPFLEGIDPTAPDYEVAVRAFENIINLIDYDSIELDVQETDKDRSKKPDNIRSIYGVFKNKKAVCAGYARAYQYLLNRMGIECSYVRGDCIEEGKKEPHAWSIVKLEGEYYYVDVTWGDRTNTDMKKSGSKEVFYDYFCVTTEELLKNREIKKIEEYPECTSQKCNYFVVNGMFFESYDAERLRNILEEVLKTGRKHVGIKAANPNVLNYIYKRMHEECGITDIMKKVSTKTAYKGIIKDTTVNTLHFVFE